MGAQIAAHLANVGIPTLLFDLDEATARQGLERTRATRPDPFFGPDVHRLITTAGLDSDLGRLASCDWIVEAIVERLDAKQALLARVEESRQPGSIVSSNTSGIPVAAIAAGRSSEFRRHWLGTHFFNPPRHLRLFELIPTAETDPLVVEAIRTFADHALGKGVVVANDTPNFIANRIGFFAAMRAFDLVARGEFSVEEVDAATGPPIGRPKSATFRTMDIAGLDVVLDVAGNLAGRLEGEEERRLFAVPALIEDMVRRGWKGEKTGQGFYRKVSQGDLSEILVLDPATMEYHARQASRLAGLERAAAIEQVDARIRTLFLSSDRTGDLLRATLGRTLVYAATVAPEIASSIDVVDRAMRWGYGWELGPFETWDAIGVREVLDACGVSEPPPLVADLLSRGRNRFRDGLVPPGAPDLLILRTAREENRVIKHNAGASLVDLGDGVLAVELHSKLNIVGEDTLQMIRAGVREAEQNFAALVIGTQAAQFSAGANLMLLLLAAREDDWEELDRMIGTFQAATSSLRYAEVPVVVATAGLVLGGGCEISLHADRVQAAAESYLGLVEAGVGLIPAAGGTKEMVVRAMAQVPSWGGVDPLPYIRRAFETIGYARTSSCAADARRLGYLRDVDAVTFNRERLLADAKRRALARVDEGYRPPLPPTDIPVGGEPLRAALSLGVHLAWRAARISDHDALIGRKLAWVMSGGSLPHAAEVSESYLLDLEREAFLSLCGERKTLERIAYTLKTGKTLRN